MGGRKGYEGLEKRRGKEKGYTGSVKMMLGMVQCNAQGSAGAPSFWSSSSHIVRPPMPECGVHSEPKQPFQSIRKV